MFDIEKLERKWSLMIKRVAGLLPLESLEVAVASYARSTANQRAGHILNDFFQSLTDDELAYLIKDRGYHDECQAEDGDVGGSAVSCRGPGTPVASDRGA